MTTAVALGVGVWILAFVGAGLIAGAIGLFVVGAFLVTAGALGVLHQRDLDDNYIVIRKDETDR